MKILVFNDPHLAAQGPASRTDDYKETCLRKLLEVKDLSEKYGCSYVLCSGDFFHLKAWNRNPTSLIADLSDLFKSFKVPIKGISGNHDQVGGDPESVSGQPLGVLARASGIHLLNKGEVCKLDEKVYLTGIPYYADIDTDLSAYLPKRPKGAGVHIHLAHGNLYPSKPMYSPSSVFSDLSGCEADYLFCGHVHSNFGVTPVGKTTKVINCGSLTRGSLSEDDIKRRPAVTILDTNTGKVEIVELRTALPADQIFDLKKVEALEKAEEEINKLGEMIRRESEGVELQGPESIRQAVRELKSIDSKTRDLINSLLDVAEASI